MEESAKIRKQVQEENKDEKRRKQAEAAAKAAEVAREAMKALEKQKVNPMAELCFASMLLDLSFSQFGWLLCLAD